MSSTERPSDSERELREFFRNRLAPVAERLRARGVRFFATGPDPSAAGYWVKHEEAESPFWTIEPDRCEALMAERWKSEGLDELAALSAPLFRLAERVAPRQADDDDLSPYIYVMF